MRLIKLMAYLLFGFAVYELVRGMVDEPEEAAQAGRTPQPGRKPRPKHGAPARAARQTPAAS